MTQLINFEWMKMKPNYKSRRKKNETNVTNYYPKWKRRRRSKKKNHRENEMLRSQSKSIKQSVFVCITLMKIHDTLKHTYERKQEKKKIKSSYIWRYRRGKLNRIHESVLDFQKLIFRDFLTLFRSRRKWNWVIMNYE